MAIYFSNAGNIELDTIRTMGVSVKENENPIGYFGTGLKYAIATLLRTGHTVSLRTNDETFQFRARPKEIRGREFQVVFMDDEQLGFTTDLGKNWEVWQAYRELYSNCMDEGGNVGGVLKEADTIFTVEGPEIAEVHAERGKIFLHSEPWLILDGVEVHRGRSDFIYYRGIRVHKLPKKSLFTYNITTNMRLTEDRTLASIFDANYKLSTRIPTATEPEYLEKVLNPEKDVYEDQFDFSEAFEPSDEFLDALEKFSHNARLSENRLKILHQRRRTTPKDETFTPTEEEMAMVKEACEMLHPLKCYVEPSELVFMEHLGQGVYACVRGGHMLFSRQCLAQGRDFMAITIYEEWIHKKFGYTDESRGLQQFLFDKILELLKQKETK
jgi:hypothetical protein